MPYSRCLGRPGRICNALIPAGQSRCAPCKKAVKDARNQQAAANGPCPQEGFICPYCHEGPRPNDPAVFCHWPIAFIDGGTSVVPGHKSCNEGIARRAPKR